MGVLTVKCSEKGWIVVDDRGAERYGPVSKQQAVLAARRFAQAERTVLRVLGPDGQVVGETTYRPSSRRLLGRR